MAKRSRKQKRKHPLRTKSKRSTEAFNLDWTKARERKVGEAIVKLKNDRKFKEACLVGIEQFAGIIDAPVIEVKAVAVATPQPDTTAIDLQREQLDREWQLLEERKAELDRRERELQLQEREMKLARDEKLTNILDAINAMQSEPSSIKRPFGFGANKAQAEDSDSEKLPAAQHGNPRKLDVPQFSAPVFDDDDDIELDVRKDESAGQRATQNFLASMSALLDDGNDYTKPVETVTEGNARKLDAPSFDAPSWDDDDDLF